MSDERQPLLSSQGSGADDQRSNERQQPRTRSLGDLFRCADAWDKVLLLLGALVSTLSGGGWPLMAAIFGGLSNTFIAAQSSLTLSKFGTSMQLQGENYTFVLPQITREEFIKEVTGYCYQYVYLGLTILIAAYVQMACWLTTCERQIGKIRREFFRSLMRQDIAWYDGHMSRQLIMQLSDNLERVKEGIGDKCGLLIQYAAQIIVGFVLAFVYSWRLTLVMMSLSPLMAASSYAMTRLVGSATRKEQQKYAIAGGIAAEIISSIETVMAFNGQAKERERYRTALYRGKKEGIMKGLYMGLCMFVTFVVMFGSYALAFWYGSTLILNDIIERGTVFVVFFSVMMGSFAIGNAGPQLTTLLIAKAAAISIFGIIERQPEIDSYSKSGKKLPDPKGRIEFRNVSFTYPSRPDVTVLNDLSFMVEPGSTVALVGHSGGGKSTIVNLLLRFYNPKSGTITLDGHQISNLNVRWLRNVIGVVSQEPVLFETTIEENIRFGRQNVTQQQMIVACRKANAHGFIAKLPDGYRTMVGEGGTQLSGGQKQRIALARALVREPKILLLDEATSSLDAESEAIVQEALDKAQQGRTTIVVAHRLSTVRKADKIIAIEEGEIKEVGTHAELMDKQGLYHQLVTAQLFEQANYTSGGDVPYSHDNTEEEFFDETDRSASRRASLHSLDLKRGSMASVLSDWSDTSGQKRPPNIMSKVDIEQERLKTDLRQEGLHGATFFEILQKCREEWPWLVIGLSTAGLRGLVMPTFSYFYSQIFDTYSQTGEELLQGSAFWAAMFVALGLVEGCAWIVSAIAFGVASENLTFRMRMAVFGNILRQDAAYFDDPRHSSAKICTRLAADASNIRAVRSFGHNRVLANGICVRICM